MFDVSWGEMLLLGGVALVVIGPKDLPRTLRYLGQTSAKLRRMAGDFQGQFHDAMREVDVQSLKNDLQKPADVFQDQLKKLHEQNPLNVLRNDMKAALSPERTQEHFLEPDFQDPIISQQMSQGFPEPVEPALLQLPSTSRFMPLPNRPIKAVPRYVASSSQPKKKKSTSPHTKRATKRNLPR
jgi:sec-independent protein translocase protein TatB